MCKNHDKKELNRRDALQQIIQYAAVAGVASTLGTSRVFAMPGLAPQARPANDPHYFLHINIPSGVDASYLFDARPLQMTKDGLIANYIGKEPVVYAGTNGETTLRTSLTDPMMKYQDRFSIINGVVMSPTLDGHDQLMNVLLTGNPFGGDSFLPWTSPDQMPMDYVSSNFISAEIANRGASMAITPDKCRALSQKIARVGGNERLTRFASARAHALAEGKTSMAQSAKRLENSVTAMGDLAAKLAAVRIPNDDALPTDSDKVKFIKKTRTDMVMLSEFMRVGLTNAGVLVLEASIDSHDPSTAQKLPMTLGAHMEAIAAAFDYLASVPSPSGRSMLDDTTFLIGSEFSRTMRQTGASIDKTGTDHNPLTNTLIVGGKGVRGGLVLGQSDFASSSETLSPLHLVADPARLKIMGRPFDIKEGHTIKGFMPQSFDITQFIGASNVTNTLQQILGVPEAKRFLLGQSMPTAATIRALIA